MSLLLIFYLYNSLIDVANNISLCPSLCAPYCFLNSFFFTDGKTFKQRKPNLVQSFTRLDFVFTHLKGFQMSELETENFFRERRNFMKPYFFKLTYSLKAWLLSTRRWVDWSGTKKYHDIRRKHLIGWGFCEFQEEEPLHCCGKWWIQKATSYGWKSGNNYIFK